jgi:hypothetical protein
MGSLIHHLLSFEHTNQQMLQFVTINLISVIIFILL